MSPDENPQKLGRCACMQPSRVRNCNEPLPCLPRRLVQHLKQLGCVLPAKHWLQRLEKRPNCAALEAARARAGLPPSELPGKGDKKGARPAKAAQRKPGA